jgi:DNA-binding LacI/PurR family transcriptional regulator
VFIQGVETVLEKRGVYITLQSEGRKRDRTAEVGNLKNKRSEGLLVGGSVVYARNRTPLICCCNAQHTTVE